MKIQNAILPILLIGGVAGPQIRAASIEVYAFTVAGQSSCPTFGPTDQVRNAIQVSSIEASTPGAGCGVTQDLQDFTAAGGNLTASSTASGGGNTSFGSYTYTGSSRSRAGFNGLGVEALGSLTGATDGFSTGSSDAFGEFTDGFTVPGANGQSGYLQVNYTIDGTQTITGRGYTTLELLWRANGGPQYSTFRAADGTAGGGASVNINGTYVNSGPGITITGNEIDVNTSQSFLVPVTFNQKTDLQVILYGSAVPGPSTGNAFPSAVDNGFYNTVSFTGFEVLDSNLNPINGAQVLRDSAAVPEPSTVLLVVIGLGVVYLGFRRSAAAARPWRLSNRA